MATNPVAAINASLRCFQELGLERPEAVSVRGWLAGLARAGLLEPEAAGEIASRYDSMRFGGKSPESARWDELALELEASAKRFGELDAERQAAIIKTLGRVAKPPKPPKPPPPIASAPIASSSFWSGGLRWTRVIGVLALAVVAGVYLLKKDEAAPAKKPHRHHKVPILSVDLSAPSATSPTGIFGSRIEFAGVKGRAVSLLDFDRDGDLDLFFASEPMLRLFENRGKVLVDVSRDFGLGEPARSGQWADVDDDGDFDLAITATRRTPVLFRRDGDRYARTPLKVQRPYNPEGLGWFDYDADGDSDLLVTNGGKGVHLFDNTGGELVDVSAAAGFGGAGWGRVNGDFIHILDVDDDDRPDLLYAGTTGLVARNVGGERFEPATLPIEFSMIDGVRKQALALGDVDGDRDIDVFAPQLKGAALVEDQGSEFAPFESPAVLALGGRARSGVFGDVDRDGDLDLVVAMRGGGLELLENNDGILERATPRSGFVELTANIDILGMAIGDVNGDGANDLVYQALDGKRGSGGLLLGQATLPPGRGTLRISWQSVPPAGAQIAVRRVGEERWQTRTLGLPSNSGSQQPFLQMFSMAKGPAQIQLRLTNGNHVCLKADVASAATTTVFVTSAEIESGNPKGCVGE